MAGVKGRSGGHNRLSVAEHLVRGTFRRDRHGRPGRVPVGGALEALRARAEALEALGMKLVEQGARAKTVPTRSQGAQMHPKFGAGLKLLEAADELWTRLARLAPPPAPADPRTPPAPAAPEPLDTFRRARHSPNGD